MLFSLTAATFEALFAEFNNEADRTPERLTEIAARYEITILSTAR